MRGPSILRRSAAFAVVLCSVLLWPAAAHAGRVVVLDFDGGKRAATVRLDLVRGMLSADGVTLVPERDYAASARSAGVGPGELTSASGIRRAAAAAAVDGVVTGRLIRKRRRAYVRVRFYDAMGERLLSRDYRLVRGHMKTDDVRRIARFVADKTQSALPPPAPTPVAQAPQPAPQPTYAPPPAPPAPEPAPQPTYAPPPEKVRATQPAAADTWAAPPPQTAPTWTPPKSETAADDWARGPSPSPGTTRPGRRMPLVSINAVAAAGRRSFLLEGDATRIQYDTVGAYPEIGVLAEAFPLRDMGPWLEGLGVEAIFFHGFVSSALDGPGNLVLATPVTRWHLDARYRVRVIPDAAFAPSLGVRGGFGISEFKVQQANPRFTTVHHDGLRLGAEISQPLLPPVLRLEAAFVLVPTANPGPAERQAYGDSVESSGWALRVGIAGDSGEKNGAVTYGLWVETSHYGDQYTGTGLRDGNVAVTEDYLSLMAGCGWSF